MSLQHPSDNSLVNISVSSSVGLLQATCLIDWHNGAHSNSTDGNRPSLNKADFGPSCTGFSEQHIHTYKKNYFICMPIYLPLSSISYTYLSVFEHSKAYLSPSNVIFRWTKKLTSFHQYLTYCHKRGTIVFSTPSVII